jgi:hypothetical protein
MGGSAGDSDPGGIGGVSGEPSAGAAGEPSAGGAGDGGAGGDGAATCTTFLDCASGLDCDPDYGCVTVCSEDVLITSVTELGAFAALGCQVLNGSLTLRSAEISSLDALAPSPLRAIREDLVFDQNPMLADIEGLIGLERIDGSLVVMSNAALPNLDGLDTLRRLGSNSVSNTLVLSQNPMLEQVTALAGVERMLLSVVVTGNASLVTLAGIDRLRATNNVTLANNTALVDLVGLSELEECGSCLAAGNGLTSLALPSLTRADSLSITGHSALVAVSLPALTTIDTSLTIASNPALETLGTLDALTSVNTLTIAGNTSLPQCFVDGLDARLSACNASCGGNDESATCN